MEVAGLEAGTGIISTAFAKDPTDPAWSEDRGVKDWRDFMSKYAPEGDIRDQSAVYAFDGKRWERFGEILTAN
jgi:branched-chain amino acid transport system substrate-binding protein